ncbi:MAG: 5-methyltetrahydrofolate S-homocysteine methyltransferase [Chloroflexi bacterium]|nr:5-methyltetrahydrofolate S-homocysteine methyltransferase [Chloroflexota bacterium]
MSQIRTSRPFVVRLQQGPLLCDGGMGTQLYAHGVAYEQGFEHQNLAQPALVERIHRAYLAAGAEVIETNTFGANALKLAQHGLADKVLEINRAGARIARAAREVSGIDALVAGSVGPLGRLLEPYSDITLLQARALFRQVIEGLVEGGVDLLILETFSDLREITEAVRAARAICDVPIVAQMTFTEELFTPTGQSPEGVAQTLDRIGVDMIGVNCSVGPQSTLQIVERMARVTGKPLSAQPNAGMPEKVAGRLLYLSSPEYMAEYAVRIVQAGARLVGGCCGTTPAHIAAMATSLATATGAVDVTTPDTVVVTEPPGELEFGAAELPTALENALQSGLAISVELAPPRGANPAKMLAGARMLRDAGVDVVNITDGAMARVRMSTLAAGYLVRQQVGLEAILHVTTRDRNMMALQADLLGAHALGVRAILALTGDPPHTGDYAHAKGVYDVDSIGLIRILSQLNQGVDVAGNAIGKPTNFLIGAALNPTAKDLDWELDRFARKLEAGATFVMTQPVYDPELFVNVLGRVGHIRVPILMGVMPLQSYRNAEFVHNELPGVSLTPEVLARMHAAGSDGQAEGLRIAQEMLQACLHLVAGVYIMPAFQRYEPAAELIRLLRSRPPATVRAG